MESAYIPRTKSTGACKGVVNDSSQVVEGYLELLIIDDENYGYFESNDVGHLRFIDQEWVETNVNTNAVYDAYWFNGLHIVLNNGGGVTDSGSIKDAYIRVIMQRPYSYMIFPAVVFLILSLIIWRKVPNRHSRDKDN